MKIARCSGRVHGRTRSAQMRSKSAVLLCTVSYVLYSTVFCSHRISFFWEGLNADPCQPVRPSSVNRNSSLVLTSSFSLVCFQLPRRNKQQPAQRTYIHIFKQITSTRLSALWCLTTILRSRWRCNYTTRLWRSLPRCINERWQRNSTKSVREWESYWQKDVGRGNRRNSIFGRIQ